MTNQEAIERLQYRIDTASEICGKGVDGKAYEDMEVAIEALKQTMWISCSENLPSPQECGDEDFSETVLVSTDVDIVTDAWYCFSEKKWYKQGFSIIGNVIAWMPSPKSYKEQH